MTDPKVLADALVEAGILHKNTSHFQYGLDDLPYHRMTADEAITDWRVAGACLLAWPTTINTEQLDMTLDEMLRDPAAICEAFTQARH